MIGIGAVQRQLAFDQVGHPTDAATHLDDGWHQMYWNPMNTMLEKV